MSPKTIALRKAFLVLTEVSEHLSDFNPETIELKIKVDALLIEIETLCD